MVGAFFLNRGHFDLIYHWLSLVTSLSVVAWMAYRAAPSVVGDGSVLGAAWRGVSVRRPTRFGRDPRSAAQPQPLADGPPLPRWGRAR
jgi:hypothetical protein